MPACTPLPMARPDAAEAEHGVSHVALGAGQRHLYCTSPARRTPSCRMALIIWKSWSTRRLVKIYSNHYRKPELCRVSYALPSAKTRALDKEPLCREPHSAKRLFTECLTLSFLLFLPSAHPEGTRQSFFLFLKKLFLCRVPSEKTLGKATVSYKIAVTTTFFCRGFPKTLGKVFAECPTKGTRQRTLYRRKICRVVFAKCGTRQRLCRVQ